MKANGAVTHESASVSSEVQTTKGRGGDRPAVGRRSSQIERRREDERPRVDDAEGVADAVGIGAHRLQVRFRFLDVAYVELEAGAHFVVEKARGVGRETVEVGVRPVVDRAVGIELDGAGDVAVDRDAEGADWFLGDYLAAGLGAAGGSGSV